MSGIIRVRDKPGHALFMSGAEKVRELDRDQALAALAAFLRVSISAANSSLSMWWNLER